MALQSASFAAMTLSVAWRRSIPLLAAGLVAGGLAVQTLAGEAPIAGGFIAVLIVMYSVASYSEPPVAVAGGLMILASAFLYPIVGDVNFADEVVNAFILIGPWVLGRAIRSRQRRAVVAESAAIKVSVEQELHVRGAVAQERGRIARDMHDIVAHGVSMMVLQSGAARQTIRTDSSKSEELLVNVEESGRQALEELHLLLDVLKAPSAGQAADATASLTIRALADLADRTAVTDTSMTFAVKGSERPLSPGLEICVYRIAQEAFTNATRHGQASNVDVVITYRDKSLGVSIRDDGNRAAPAPERLGGGNGLIGMRERAELFSGTVTAGPRHPGPGWLVTAELPIPQLI
jgi:signal transduction histidine kinase